MSVSGPGLESRRSPRKGLSRETKIAGKLEMVIGAAAARRAARRSGEGSDEESDESSEEESDGDDEETDLE